MRKPILLALVAFAALALASTAAAKGGGAAVVKRGSCSGASTWKLTLKHDDGRIETQFEVDQNRNGRRWRVKLFRNGHVAFDAIRTTHAPSGSFEVRRLLGNGPGRDRIVATARALATGETCRAAATI